MHIIHVGKGMQLFLGKRKKEEEAKRKKKKGVKKKEKAFGLTFECDKSLQ